MDGFPRLLNSLDKSEIQINNTTFSIGRSLSCDYILQSIGISRFHCVLKKSNDKWLLFDRSTNGTFVNSKVCKFNESIPLKNGDAIKLSTDMPCLVFIEPNGTAPLDFILNDPVPEDVEAWVDAADCKAPEPEPVPSTSSATLEDKPPPANKSLDIMESELTCSICSELFIKAVTLTCSHTFCKYCIGEWRKNKSTCPICRKRIISTNPTLVLDNFIDKIIDTQEDEAKANRRGLIKQREEADQNTAGSSQRQRRRPQHDVISLLEESEALAEAALYQYDMTEWDYINTSDDDDDEDDDDDDDDDDDYRGTPRAYYGGYGRCYICNQSGHWANGCPLKLRRS